ncbi:hypothetical protein [Spirosoma rhododendri]|uniref:Uncharacterized protein n=1 Tax=Spirosoma rhododendri TaxID=2728024 RepID=A0A7L5DTD4_9BACT|nr:hypothetical protein [Spirosoma rhododendri]QJD80553.1 hypothetical protein HH216_20640 [Spirosoma rhododendri]
MLTHGYYFHDPQPDDKICTLLSIGLVGVDVHDDVFERGIGQVDHIVCLGDRDRLLQSPVSTTVCSDRLTIFNTARELLALLPDQPTCFVLGPDARDLRITLALTEIKPELQRRGVWLAFVIAPAAPTEDWMALLRELEKRISRVYLFEPAMDGRMPIRETVSIAVFSLIRFLENYDAGRDICAPWKRSGRLLVSQCENTGPDSISQLIAQMPQRLTDEQCNLLATNHALLDVQSNPEQYITLHEFSTMRKALVDPFANKKFNMQVSIDESLPEPTIRAVLVLWKTLWPERA